MTLPTEPVRTVHEICALLAGSEASDLSPPDLQAAWVLMERTPVMQDRGTPPPRGQTPPERYRRQDGHGPARPADGAPRARIPRAVPRAPLQRYGTAPARADSPLPLGPRSSGRITPNRPPWAGAANRRKSTQSPRERSGSALPARQAPRLHAFNARARSRTLSVLPRIPPGRCRRRHDPGGGPVAGPPPKTCIPSGGGPCTAGHPEPGLQTTGRVRATPDAWPWHPLAGREPSRPDVVSAVSRRPPLPLECRFPTWQRLRVPSRSRTASETPGWP